MSRVGFQSRTAKNPVVLSAIDIDLPVAMRYLNRLECYHPKTGSVNLATRITNHRV